MDKVAAEGVGLSRTSQEWRKDVKDCSIKAAAARVRGLYEHTI